MKTEIGSLVFQVIISESELSKPIDNVAELQETLYNSHEDFFSVAVDDHGVLVFIEIKVTYKEDMAERRNLVESKVKEVFKNYIS